MSATNRGSEREIFDSYPTPLFTVDKLLKVLDLPSGYWLEPASGSCGLIKQVNYHKAGIQWTAIEIDELHLPAIKGTVENNYIISDFLTIDLNILKKFHPDKEKFDVIFTNPPYNLAFEFLQKSLQVSDTVVMLLRLNFLASKKRFKFMQEQTPDVYVLPKRPSFKKTLKSNTDACDYAWFVWNSNNKKTEGKIIVLDY